MPNNLKFLYLMEIFSGVSRGSYLVCIGWITLILSDNVARVGQIFIVAMLTNIIAGPFIGVVVDRYSRKAVVIGANLAMGLIMAALALGWIYEIDSLLSGLFLAVAAISALRLAHHGAHDALIQSSVEPSYIGQTVARFRTIHLLATVAGTIGAGSIIERVSPGWGLLFSASASVLLVLPMGFVISAAIKENQPGLAGFIGDFLGGIEIFQNNRTIRLMAILTGVSLPIGQLSNAILSSFIRDDLGKGSEAFAIVDAAWPLGGMAAGALLSFGITKLHSRNMEYIFALAAGISTIGLSYCTSVSTLMVFHGAMGLTVWLCRIIIDARILEACHNDVVGRTKVTVHMVFSASAMIMCFSPTIIELPSTSAYFLFWGSVMVIVSGGLWFWQFKISGNDAEPHNVQ